MGYAFRPHRQHIQILFIKKHRDTEIPYNLNASVYVSVCCLLPACSFPVSSILPFNLQKYINFRKYNVTRLFFFQSNNIFTRKDIKINISLYSMYTTLIHDNVFLNLQRETMAEIYFPFTFDMYFSCIVRKDLWK